MTKATRLIELMDPRGEPQPEVSGFAPRPETLDGKVIGFLNNGKPSFDLLLSDLAELLSSEFSIEVIQRTKPVIARPVPTEMAREIHESCDVLVTGLGD